MSEYDDTIIDSNKISSTDRDGRPIPVTIPIALAPGVTVVYTTRLGGLSTGDYGNLNLGGKSGDDPEAVLSNRVALAEAIGARLSLVSQVHSGIAVDVDSAFEINTPFGFDVSGTNHTGDAADSAAPQVKEADGQVTTRTGIALGMFAADCLPVLMADPEAGVIGAAHCGRRGLEKGVIGATVDLMKLKGADPNRIVATLGPRICGDCYEVGDEIADTFEKRFPLTRTTTRFGGAGIDIAEAAMIDLAFAGVSHVVDSMPRVHAATEYLEEDTELAELCRTDGEGPAELAERIGAINHSMCTLENPLWYSHRRASKAGKTHEGRLLALIVRH
ncbi:copper oxidase [Bifidobacterium sp. UTCIF-37]|uniref:YfiH family protein n=1 Tax=Bifidobacterium callitrichos DSM 23973 TaxID=1437609 RepID=A0A087A8V9_9BIFI|nr:MULTISPECIES: polyphenol oxidase family protein [Bifidobacterium]KFI55209.1 YfiH family protein [Bifidobacterium callitrichos DSM 23973]TPF86859.1 copper oxidase [Bifidobacterium sp. UTCIF-37]TPF90448.1 copper oxidase [Bifidobacterium sp. UTCIF-38]